MESDEKSCPISVKQVEILRQYQQKSSKLLYKLTQHFNVVTRNDNGEIVVFGKAVPGTHFDNLYKSMVGRTRDLNQYGIKKFLTALKEIGVCSKELSGKALHTTYLRPVPLGSSRHQLAALKAKPSSIKMAELLEKYVTPKHTPLSSSSSPSNLNRKYYSNAVNSQERKGLKKFMPPGRRAKILYVY